MTKPYQSKLIPRQKEIFKMWYSRKTLKEIQKYLNQEGVKISLPGISLFISRRSKRPDPRYAPDHLKHFLKDTAIQTATEIVPEAASLSEIPNPQEWNRIKAKKK